ncbi:helix-turn-helix domain-containing protein [Edwardsiella tarda]|uniref:Helix-turn-helix domain-containing protein n=1 Tax=Edwardsiella tarda ATCC 15947 = NBRC 105688 TaxID=667121 RepID=A0AC61TG37_EDWTA|nr:hypothetical protein [Edwardsiella tarda]UAL57454.1 helix-turn-helix domain-containing protein [Edwardsiella tarda]UCP99488.1 helix-turn-helix domain-containing protein [Edwardsiella tarda ATCC 15947 = NBRC 105688]
MNPIKVAVDAVGGQTAAAKICGLSVVAVHKWTVRGTLPRTEYTGKTSYAKKLSSASNGAFTPDWLLSAANPDLQG